MSGHLTWMYRMGGPSGRRSGPRPGAGARAPPSPPTPGRPGPAQAQVGGLCYPPPPTPGCPRPCPGAGARPVQVQVRGLCYSPQLLAVSGPAQAQVRAVPGPPRCRCEGSPIPLTHLAVRGPAQVQVRGLSYSPTHTPGCPRPCPGAGARAPPCPHLPAQVRGLPLAPTSPRRCEGSPLPPPPRAGARAPPCPHLPAQARSPGGGRREPRAAAGPGRSARRAGLGLGLGLLLGLLLGLRLALLLHRPRGLGGPGAAALLLQPPAGARVQAGARVREARPEAGERVAARRALLLHRAAHRLPRAAARPRRALLGVLADVDHDDVALEVHHLPAGNKRGVTVSSHISYKGKREHAEGESSVLGGGLAS
ncbi:hypothetical protein VULLAG_LOCUS12450 [Vulpes lagopus]